VGLFFRNLVKVWTQQCFIQWQCDVKYGNTFMENNKGRCKLRASCIGVKVN